MRVKGIDRVAKHIIILSAAESGEDPGVTNFSTPIPVDERIIASQIFDAMAWMDHRVWRYLCRRFTERAIMEGLVKKTSRWPGLLHRQSESENS